MPLPGASGKAITSNGSKWVSGDPALSATATALASNPTDCSAGTFANAIDASGNLTCVPVSGGINYIANSDAEADASGWATYADAAAATPVNGTGGSASSTYARSTSSPLRGTGSFLWTHSAANRQGEGFSYDFTIADADKGKVLVGSLNYAIASGTYADNDLDVWVYDVTNSALIQPAPYHLKNHALAADRFTFEFQTITSSNSYRVIFHVTTTTATAYTVKFDDWLVGPQAKLYGSPITDWVAFTPTDSWSNTTYTGFHRRVGDSDEIIYQASATSVPSGALTFNPPSGLTFDTTKLTSGGVKASGSWVAEDNGVQDYGGSVYATSSLIGLIDSDGTGIVTNTAPFTTGSGDWYSARVLIPIVGWSSSAVMSNDASTRVVGARAFLSADQTGVNPNASAIKINIDSTASSGGGYDTNGAWASNKYTVQVPGKYSVNIMIAVLGTNVLANGYQAAIYKNGSIFAYGETAVVKSAADYLTRGVSTSLDLIAGDYIEAYLFGAGNNSVSTLTADGIAGGNATYIDITRISGPAQIAAGESINARYIDSATSVSGSLATVVWTTKDFDSHSGMSSGVYTCQSQGKYQVNSFMTMTGTFALNSLLQMQIQVSSTSVSESLYYAGGIITRMTGQISDIVNCPAGGTIRLQVSNSGTSPIIDSTTKRNWISISRVGN